MSFSGMTNATGNIMQKVGTNKKIQFRSNINYNSTLHNKRAQEYQKRN